MSHDSGQTWRRQPLPRPWGTGTLSACQCSLTGPVFTSAQDGALWVSDLPGPPARAQAAYLTRDGGRTWSPIHLPDGRVPLQTPDFVDGKHGFVTGGRLARHGQTVWGARLYATSDGGVTWTARSASPLLNQATLDFVTPAAGFAALNGYNPPRSYLLTTSDGGTNWTAVPARLASR